MRAGTVIGRRNVDAWSDEVFLDQFVGVAAGDPFQLAIGVESFVDLNRPFGSPERDIEELPDLDSNQD